MSKETEILEEITGSEYKYGFTTDIETETLAAGLSEETVKFISAKKNEPAWMLEWRLAAFAVWKTMTPPQWQNLSIPEINFQDIIYYAAPKQKKVVNSLDDIDPELRRTFEKLGISFNPSGFNNSKLSCAS